MKASTFRRIFAIAFPVPCMNKIRCPSAGTHALIVRDDPRPLAVGVFCALHAEVQPVVSLPAIQALAPVIAQLPDAQRAAWRELLDSYPSPLPLS